MYKFLYFSAATYMYNFPHIYKIFPGNET